VARHSVPSKVDFRPDGRDEWYIRHHLSFRTTYFTLSLAIIYPSLLQKNILREKPTTSERNLEKCYSDERSPQAYVASGKIPKITILFSWQENSFLKQPHKATLKQFFDLSELSLQSHFIVTLRYLLLPSCQRLWERGNFETLRRNISCATYVCSTSNKHRDEREKERERESCRRFQRLTTCAHFQRGVRCDHLSDPPRTIKRAKLVTF